MGNIATYETGGEKITYTYDAQGQLLKAVGDETYTYTYDAAGNILTASNGTVSHSYTYGNTNWRDLLTAFDGESITYDAIGNPTSYYNGTRWTFGWSNGRQLTSASNGTNNITYTYTADGMRTSKVVDGVTYNYYYASGKLLRQTWGSNTLDFFYDTSGTPYALKHNGTLYYYITNLQGDVLHLIDGSGNIAATYEYDPYGNILTATGTMAATNPLRYRGYYYDTETGLYYVSSRYYDPEIGRWISADSLLSTGQGVLGNNMFAYCNSNPVNLVDKTGTEPDAAIDTDGDGEEDCFVYEYSYTKYVYMRYIVVSYNISGCVYIYTNKSSESDFNSVEYPEGFDAATDLLVGDWTNSENPTMFAYQAQKINPQNRDEIVDILFTYVSDFNKDWKRTKDSVLIEWKEHHRYSLFSRRAQNIDFDEKEEGKDFWYFLAKAWNSI